MSYKPNTLYIGTVGSYLVLGVCFAKLVKTGLWAVWAEHHALCTVHFIFIHASQEGIKCTKAKEQLRSYCLIYILCVLLLLQTERIIGLPLLRACRLGSCKLAQNITRLPGLTSLAVEHTLRFFELFLDNIFMVITCQRFVILFLIGLVWQYSTNQNKYKTSWLFTCSSK